ncbi:MAG TPA: hypothetical protein VER75_00625 [Thermoleophilaceae bacterium]|nr:hypothetical protein [Thermoleophilaceae bacterium]
MDARDLAVLHAGGRLAVGAAFVLAPGLAGRVWIGDDAGKRPVKVLARAFGVRDAVLALGVLISLDRGAPVRGWLAGGILSDVVDVAAVLLAGDSIPAGRRRGCAALGASSTALGAALARAVEDPASSAPRGV